MKARLLTLVVVLALVLGVVPVISAQGDNFLTCFNLSEADCATLMAAEENSANVKSFMMDFTVDIALGGLNAMGAMMGGETSGAGDTTIHVTGSGPFTLAETNVFPPAAMQLDITYTVEGSESASGTTSFVLVDGVAYALNPDTGAWEGALVTDLLESSGLTSLLGGLAGGDLSQLPAGALTPDQLLGGNAAAMLESSGLSEDTIMSILQTPGFIDYQRLADAELLGQPMQVFSLSINSAPLFASSDFQTLLNQLLTSAASQDPSAAQAAMMVPMLLTGATITLNQTQYVGVSDTLIHGVSLDLNAALDLNALMPPSTAGTPTMQLPPITLTFHFEVTMDQINQTFEIVAPAGATMTTP
jgi:hypothetical protein